MGDVGRQEQVAVARAALGIAARDVVEDAYRHPPGGEAGEGVDVIDHDSLRTISSPAAGFEGFIRTLGTPTPVAEIPTTPAAPPDMAPVLRAAADHSLEILGPPGIPT